jgi:choline kinase
MKGVIIAAGAGTRLKDLTRDIPKPLINVRGKPLIEYTLQAFIETGFKKLGIVLGHKGHLLQRHLGDGSRYNIRIEYLPNDNYWRGNATSISACRSFIGHEPFIVSVADHMISPEILQLLLESYKAYHTLCVDRQKRIFLQINDATKVWVNESGFVERIGKKLQHCNAIDTGVFLFRPGIFEHISAYPHKDRCSITRIVMHMIASGHLISTCDVSGSFWFDVDTQDDLRDAQSVMRQRMLATAEE